MWKGMKAESMRAVRRVEEFSVVEAQGKSDSKN